MYKHILLCIDNTENSYRAAEEAVKIVSCNSNPLLYVLHIADIAKAKNEVLHTHSTEELEYLRRKKFERFEILLKENNINYTFSIKHGDPAQIIVKTANDGLYDLIIIGGRDKMPNPIPELMLGSVSSKIAKKVKIPVVIIK